MATALTEFADRAAKEAADLEWRLTFAPRALRTLIQNTARHWRHVEADARDAANGCEASFDSVISFIAEDEYGCFADEDWSDLARPAESYVPGVAA